MKNERYVIVSAPSGSGKTTIVKYLLDQNLPIRFSVSATSRPKRRNEVDGVDYHFMTADEFRSKIDAGDFLEWQEVYPNQFYGTLKSEVDRISSDGYATIFDTDVVGGLNLKKIFGANALALFIEPPSIRELEKRLRDRGTETESSIAKRIAKAKEELESASRFDSIVVNSDLKDAEERAFRLVYEFTKKDRIYTKLDFFVKNDLGLRINQRWMKMVYPSRYLKCYRTRNMDDGTVIRYDCMMLDKKTKKCRAGFCNHNECPMEMCYKIAMGWKINTNGMDPDVVSQKIIDQVEKLRNEKI